MFQAILDTLDTFVDHPLYRKTDLDTTVLIDATFGAIAEILAAAHKKHVPHDCSCEENAIRSLRYAIANARSKYTGEPPPYAQH